MSSQYDLKIHKRVKKQIAKIEKKEHPRIQRALEKLAKDPLSKGNLRLRGLREKVYRIKVPPFRILYVINREEDLIEVHAILHRKEAYRSLTDFLH